MTEVKDILEDQIKEARRSLSAEGYPMSIGELTNLYRENELQISPAYQRLYRWSDLQKSRLIESLLLGIPLPSIFVAQTEEGTWELIDGLQRVSTILQLQGELQGKPSLVLQRTKFLPALEGKQWEHEDPRRSFSAAQRLDIKRSKIDIKIIKRESSPEAKYDLFQRLNSYGSSLTAQELRSALLAAASPGFLSWLERLSKFEPFVETTLLSDRLLDERYDLELVLRFLVLHARPTDEISISSLKDFPQLLDDKALEMAIANPSGSEELEGTFKRTFSFIAQHGGEKIFRRWDQEQKEFKGSFLNTAFEVFALGVGYHVAAGNKYRPDLLNVSQQLWSRSDMERGYATGRSTEARLSQFIPLGRKLLAVSDGGGSGFSATG